MKIIRLVTAAFFLSLLSSCGLIQSALKLPVGILRAVGRTAGLNTLTDEAADPVAPETEKKEPASEE